jgi:ribosomal-protein-alanine N-acetyltransferase
MDEEPGDEEPEIEEPGNDALVSSGLRQIKSSRLNLIAGTAALIKQDIAGKLQLAKTLEVDVPESWPPDLYGPGAMQFALEQLGNAAEQGWSFWYLVLAEEPCQLTGICGFKGRPDDRGSVEIGYSILDCFQTRGLATEAVATLVGWAFSHFNVKEISAETFPHLRKSIRVLEKNGFSLAGAGSESGVVRYTLQRSSRN